MLDARNFLHPDIFSDAPIEKPSRDGFGAGLVISADRDSRIVALCADLSESTRMLAFREKYPHRFVQIGVAEQNLATVASGMSAMGKIPFITSYAMFSPGRNWEQIRTTICYNDRIVHIVGSHAGVSVGPDGGTHQAIEDIAITQVIPRMSVVAPVDAEEAKKATLAVAQSSGPHYIRLAREKTMLLTREDTPFALGEGLLIWKDQKPRLLIISTGTISAHVARMTRTLSRSGVPVAMLHIPSVKPLDREAVVSLAREAGRVITIEEHQRSGGVGSLVAQLLGEEYPCPVRTIGVMDRFGQSGTPEELLKEYGLDELSLAKQCRDFMQKQYSR